MKDELIFYRPNELDDPIEVVFDEKRETIWLTQTQLAQLFGTQRPAITKHLKNIFNSQELEESVVCSILERTTAVGEPSKVLILLGLHYNSTPLL